MEPRASGWRGFPLKVKTAERQEGFETKREARLQDGLCKMLTNRNTDYESPC